MKTKSIMARIITVLSLPILSLLIKNQSSIKVGAYDSLGNRWFTGYNCSVNTYLDKALNVDGYTGFTTEITPAEGADNVRVTMNTTCKAVGYFGDGSSVGSNNAELILAFEQYSDASAKLIMFTYQSIENPDYKLSVIVRKHNASYSGVTVAFTDQIEFVQVGDSIYSAIKGTNAYTVGYYNSSSPEGYRKEGRIIENSRSPVMGTADFRIMSFTNGQIGMSQWSNQWYANILSEDFLNASKENLPADSPYRALYTTEYATELLAALSKTGSSPAGDLGLGYLSITYIGINRENLVNRPLAFRIRQFDGTWLGDNVTDKTPKFNFPFITPKLDDDFKQIVLSKQTSYAVSNIIDVHNAVEVDGVVNVWYTGYSTADPTLHDNDHWVTTSFMKWVSSDVAGKGLVSISIRAYCNNPSNPNPSWSNRYSPLCDIYYDVDESHVHHGTLVEHVDPTETQDGVVEHFECDICHDYFDKNGNKLDTIVIPAYGVIDLPESLDITANEGFDTYFPIPVMEHDYMYTIQLYDSNNNPAVEGNGISYVFEADGVYKVVYSFEITSTLTIVREVVLNVTVVTKAPVITIHGTYEYAYYLGSIINVFDAVASDGVSSDFEVGVKLFVNEADKGNVGQSVTANELGTYRLRYYSEYTKSGRQGYVYTDVEFDVIKDETPPSIILNGAYLERYERGTKLEIKTASCYDAIGEIGLASITVKYNDEVISIENNELTLNKKGNVEIIYETINRSGIENSLHINIEVYARPSPKKKGCGGNVVTTSILISSLSLIFASVLLVSKTIKKNAKKEEE